MWKLILMILGLSFVYYKCVADWERVAFKNFNIKRWSGDQEVFPEEETDYNLEIVNNKIFPLLWLTIRYDMPGGLTIKGEEKSYQYKHGEISAHNILLSLFLFQKVKHKYKIFFKERGYYHLNKIQAVTSDYFGFKKVVNEYDCPVRFVVYPKLYPIEELIIKENSYLGENIVKRWIMDDPTYFSGVREYTFNEPIKQIHWKASAKTGDLQVKVNDYSADVSILYVLDLGYDRSEHVTSRHPLSERLIEVVAAYIHLAEEKQYEYGFATNYIIHGESIKSIIVPPNRGEGHLASCFQMLAKIMEYANIDITNLLYDVANTLTRSTVISLTTYNLNDKLIDALNDLRLRGFIVEINTYEEELENWPVLREIGEVKVIKEGGLKDGR
ncbi:DUF58 domain-containing protein [Proteinivorax hydrogeniformans]|uniref:DUF58 domain-containing protein n=1 Tax=Proteinivorax hydrogeniformans TaxID=1826727 RepID=A0AAU8HTI7_9FIRM